MRLLLIEDDDILGEGLRDFLRVEGHAVDWCRTLRDTGGLRDEPYDALLVDWQLPDGSGLDWLRERRTRGDATPAVMLTARDRLGDRIHGLDSGADDYLVKPFAHEELMARIRTLLRRQQPHNAVVLTCGDLVVDLDAHAVRRGNRAIDLTAQEFRLLEHFVRHRERVLSRSQLLNAVWELETDTTSNVVDVYVRYLRQKLEEGDEVRLLHTIRGVGYVLRSPEPPQTRGLGRS